MTDETFRIRWAQGQIAEQDKIVAEADAKKQAALARKADLEAFIRVEKMKSDEWVEHPIQGAIVAAAESFDASARGAKKRAILTMLQGFNAAMTTSTIVMTLPSYNIVGATTENTSPQLSAYKGDGLVTLVDDGWKITQKGRDYLAEKN